MEMARAAEEMFSAIGQNHSALYAKSIYDDIRDTFRRELIDFDTMTVFGSTQTAQCWALYYGAFNEDEKERAFARLLDLIHEKGDTFDMGCLGLHAIFHVLAQFGEDELAFNMIAGDKFPSYTLLIDKGQTALPEQFYDYGEVYRDSLNHHFLGDTSRWFTFRIAGLEIIDDKTVKINPCRVKSIDFASAYYELPLGKVSVSWKRLENGEIDLSYTAPEGVKVIK
jgi:alpha-L-rhamnosidase